MMENDSIITIFLEEISSSYKDLLLNINKCLCMIKSLETERTYREMITDWTVGQRGNIPRLVKLMEDLKKEVENGLCLFMKLIRTINELQLLDLLDRKTSNCVSGIMKPYGCSIVDMYSRLCQVVASLQEVGIIRRNKKIETIAKEMGLCCAALTGAVLLTPGVGIVYMLGMLGYSVARLDGTKRGCNYLEIHSLFESLKDPTLMSTLQTAHFTIENMIKEVNALRGKCEAREKEIKSNSSQKILQIETDLRNSESRQKNGVTEALKLYQSTQKKVLRELVTEEPDMNEETRKRMAIKAAKNSCISFLKVKLDYNDADADEFVELLQN